MDIRHYIDIVESASTPQLPDVMKRLAKDVAGKSWESAKRFVVAKVGSVGPRERFDDDTADAVFARIQRNSQKGQYDSEDALTKLGRGAHRLEGNDRITLYRAAPKGGGIRPGDFCASTKDEAGYYLHGGHVMQTLVVPRHDVFAVDGSMGGGQELVYLPASYTAQEPQEWFSTFRDFYEAAVVGQI